MVYTKHFVIHTMKHLKQSEEYIKNATKTLVDKKENTSYLDNIFPYITSANKTVNKQLVSSHGITDVYHATQEFMWTKELKAMSRGTNYILDTETGKMVFDKTSLEKNNQVLAHHLIQSFSPEDDLTPEEIHAIGRKTVLELTGGEYEFVIATHVDQEHIHNHIIFNSTNLTTGKSFRWQKGTKKVYEQISDKHAAKAGAKIIQKTSQNSHKKYTMWQTENIFKQKIKSRLDFLLEHSHNLEDFKMKAAALNLSVDFSGKHTTYKLLDEPQIKNTRGRSLSKSNPAKYNLEAIIEKLENNNLVISIEEALERYEEKIESKKEDFDYQINLESWQIDEVTSRGYYMNIDFGVANHGQLFIPGYKIDKLENGEFSLYLKKNDFFYFMNDKKASRNRYMTGETLMKQLSLYNGTVPLKKEPVISSLHELVSAMNFLIEHGVNEGNQMQKLEDQLENKIQEAQAKLDELDDKIVTLNQAAKAALSKEEVKEKVEPSSESLQQELASIRLGREVLVQEFDSSVNDLNRFREIEYSEIKIVQSILK
ncbi:relaxase/mobilization nuclease domain-containing protein [Lactococcus garvieae]|uniref:Relaxase/mobilization nuclease domain-containing protein n=1 Tax=Lactococcus garvieae TaxID=1363 RepID=A0AA46TVE5_9LACT|nr:relaxase/mobilization nuclease domain-containing protein [Lactococcus garvieae]UYT10327.1 relaxase/mobilization nuclease domain-containing protein [Lactococcus garvieae]UYT12341.1 relaxase/mobilization nuclease domain-containing protein [Lactococcus garvieae]